MTTANRMKIIPKRERCICGRKVLNHHWFCDICYSKRTIDNSKILNKKLIGKFNPPKWMKNKDRRT